MNKLEKKLNNLLTELDGVEKSLAEFEVNPIIIQYRNLKLKKTDINSKIYDLRYNIKMNKMEKCGVHYFVGDYSEGCYCLKCGFSTKLKIINKEKGPEKDAIFNYWTKHRDDFESTRNYEIDTKLAQKIYNRILEDNPGIDVETAIKYFEIALDNIIGCHSWDRAKNRAKRFGVKRPRLYVISRN